MPIRLTRSVKYIAIACVAAFVVQHTVDQFFGGNLLGWFGLVPSGFALHYRFWQLFTYAFLHADVMHLFFNMLVLVFIGSELEAVWGMGRFLRYYFFCSVSAGILYLLLQMFIWGGEGLQIPMVGASGGIYGLLLAYGLIFGERILLFMLLFPMKAKYFVWILGGVEFFTTLFSGKSGLSSAAHLGGMLAGLGYLWVRATWIVARQRRAEGRSSFWGRGRSKRKGNLRLVIDNEQKAGRHRDDDSDDQGPKIWN